MPSHAAPHMTRQQRGHSRASEFSGPSSPMNSDDESCTSLDIRQPQEQHDFSFKWPADARAALKKDIDAFLVALPLGSTSEDARLEELVAGKLLEMGLAQASLQQKLTEWSHVANDLRGMVHKQQEQLRGMQGVGNAGGEPVSPSIALQPRHHDRLPAGFQALASIRQSQDIEEFLEIAHQASMSRPSEEEEHLRFQVNELEGRLLASQKQLEDLQCVQRAFSDHQDIAALEGTRQLQGELRSARAAAAEAGDAAKVAQAEAQRLRKTLINAEMELQQASVTNDDLRRQLQDHAEADAISAAESEAIRARDSKLLEYQDIIAQLEDQLAATSNAGSETSKRHAASVSGMQHRMDDALRDSKEHVQAVEQNLQQLEGSMVLLRAEAQLKAQAEQAQLARARGLVGECSLLERQVDELRDAAKRADLRHQTQATEDHYKKGRNHQIEALRTSLAEARTDLEDGWARHAQEQAHTQRAEHVQEVERLATSALHPDLQDAYASLWARQTVRVAVLKACWEEASTAVKTAMAELQALNGVANNLASKLELERIQCAGIRAMMDELRDDLETQTHTASEAQARCSCLSDQVESLKHEQAQTQSDAEASLREQQGMAEELASQRAQASQLASTFEAALASASQDHAAHVQALERQHQAELMQARAEASLSAEMLEELQAFSEQLQQEHGSLKDQLQDCMQSQREAAASLVEVKEALRTANRDKTAALQQLEALQGEAERLEAEAHAAAQELALRDLDCSALRGQLAATHEAAGASMRRVEALSSELARSHRSREEAEGQVAAAQQETEAVQQEASERLQQLASQLQTELRRRAEAEARAQGPLRASSVVTALAQEQQRQSLSHLAMQQQRGRQSREKPPESPGILGTLSEASLTPASTAKQQAAELSRPRAMRSLEFLQSSSSLKENCPGLANLPAGSPVLRGPQKAFDREASMEETVLMELGSQPAEDSNNTAIREMHCNALFGGTNSITSTPSKSPRTRSSVRRISIAESLCRSSRSRPLGVSALGSSLSFRHSTQNPSSPSLAMKGALFIGRVSHEGATWLHRSSSDHALLPSHALQDVAVD
ncbi:hypothetical protein WJX84_001401 [Apatococcus fuscideae]|uniref:Uncharacterized protein n=1 Tax=Apatococcus fuscideae TaxID=2026836 RepID=A0AAW1TFB3_9CHLO